MRIHLVDEFTTFISIRRIMFNEKICGSMAANGCVIRELFLRGYSSARYRKAIHRTILSLILILTGCTPLYYECEIEAALETALPQTTSVIDVPFSYVLVQTRFQPGIVYQNFRYRATIDGTEYSAAETPVYPFLETSEPQAFQVVVPENDSHLQRIVRIETSVKDLFGKKDWGEWKTVYEGTQAALPEGEPLALEGIGEKVVRLVTETGMSVDLDIDTGPSGIALRAILLRGDLVFSMSVANNVMSTRGGDATEVIRLGVPLNHVTFHSYRKGDIYMDDCGGLSFENETRKRGINGRETYLGTVSESGMDAFSSICDDCRRFDGKTMTLTLAN